MHSDIPIWFALGFLWASKSTPLRQLPMNTLPPSLLYRIWSIASISTPFETSFTINLVQQVAPRAGYLDLEWMQGQERPTQHLNLHQPSVSKPVQSDIRRLHHLDAPSTRSFASDCFHPSRPSQSRQIRAKVQLLIVREVVASQVGDEKSKARE
ncbi:hypothetical protein IWX49DRAFT_376395 [Phyllosticta citricarpa]|uniref:Uncharacterized protein n=1 Tax=Phyllosticta paracitricarpa TaxID=2016321 RepID=A0ABR1MVH0_9PEZI